MSKERTLKPLSVVLALLIGIVACAPKGDALYARAEQSFAKGEVQAAVIDLKNLLQDEPQNARARALLGRALAASGDFNAAGIELQKAKDLGAPSGMTLVPDCQVMVAKGEFDAALAECDPEGADAEHRTDLQLVRGQALLGLKRDREAREQFQAALAVQPNSLDARLGLAESTATIEGLAAAKAIIDEAPDAARDQPRYWMVVGRMHTTDGDPAGAEHAYLKAVDLARNGHEASSRLESLGALAEAQLSQGKVKEAASTGDEMAKIAPDHPRVKQLRGQIASADGRLDDARTLFEQAVAAMPNNQDARLLLGLVNLRQGNLGQAEMHFANVVANQPENFQANRLLADTRARQASPQATLVALNPAEPRRGLDSVAMQPSGSIDLTNLAPSAGNELVTASSLLISGDLDGAVDVLAKKSSGGEAGQWDDYRSVVELLRRGERDKAFAQVRVVLQSTGDDAAVRNFVGGVYVAGGRLDEGRQQFNSARELAPEDSTAQINLGRLELATGNATEADRNFRSALDLDPKNLSAMLGAAIAAGAQGNLVEAEKWLQKAGADHPESADIPLVRTQIYLRAGDLGKARAAVEDASAKFPDNAAVSNARGFVLLAAKDVPGALASFQKATTQAPGTHSYALNVARVHLLNRELDAALDVLNVVLESEPGYLPALALAATASMQAGQLEKATGYVERLRKIAPAASATHWLEGDLAMAQQRYRDALDHYRQAGAGGSNSTLIMAQYAAGSRAGVTEPQKVLEDWLAANPHDVAVVTVLADHHQRNGNVAGAIRLYQDVLVSLPENVVVLNNLAGLYQREGDPQAIELAARAYALAPASPAIQDTYGWLLVTSGDLDRGLELLRSAVRRLPDNAEVQYHYAVALAQKGNTDEAIPLLRKALGGQLSPAVNADAEQLLQQLAD